MSDSIIVALITTIGGAAIAGFFSLLKERKKDKSKRVEEDKEIISKIDALSTKLDAHIAKDEETKATEARARILSFGDETRRGILHSEEAWNDLLRNIDQYSTYCVQHPTYENNIASQTIKYLKALHTQCLEKNNFL